MKQYLLFASPRYYPEGGWNDFCGDFDTLEDALLRLVDTEKYDSYFAEYWHIIDSRNMKCVKSKGYMNKDKILP